MFLQRRWNAHLRFLQGLTLLCGGWMGCVSGPEPTGEPLNYGIEKDGHVWVRRPWIAQVSPSRASPQEAAGVTFPKEPLDIAGNVSVTGPLFVAMQVAMEDFLPWDIQPHKGATPSEVCLYKRESYDMVAAPGPDGQVFVQIWARPGTCEMGLGPILDVGAYYAIDTKTWRILAVRR